MAFVTEKQFVTFRIRGKDGTGAETDRYKRYEYTGADLSADASAMAGILQAITQGTIIGFTTSTSVYNDAVGVIPEADMHKELVMTAVDATVPTKKHTLVLPAPNGLALTTDGLGANIGGPEFDAFVNVFKSAGDWTVSDGESIASTSPIIASRVRAVRSGKSYTD
jgi:hypothetical protein